MEFMTHKDKFIYKSSYDRGLEHLLRMWPEIKKELPKATLEICYGWDLYLKSYANNPMMMKWKNEMDEMMKQDGITHHGRVSKVKLDELTAKSDLWVYPTHFEETNCHPAGTFVETAQGDIEIEKLCLSDKVRTKDGYFKNITAIRSKDVSEKMYNLEIQSNENLQLTGDHPVLVIKKQNNDKSKSLKEIIKREKTWVNASDLEEGDVVVSSRKLFTEDFKINLSKYLGSRKNNLPTEENILNEDLDDAKALWFGYFAGDGHANRRGKIEILVAKSHKGRDYDNVINGFKSWNITPTIREENGYYKIQGYSYKLAKFLIDNFYDSNKSKYIPTELRSNDLVFQGLIYSDGSIGDYNNRKGISYSYTSVSRKLISSVRFMAAKKGYAGKVRLRTHLKGKDSYSIRWTEVDDRKFNFYEKDEDYIYYKIKNISKQLFVGKVYNIDVADEHNYHANGIVVHNCITALDSQKLGCVPVTINLAALQDTVFSGVKIDGDITEQNTKEEFIKELVALAKDQDRLKAEKQKAIEGAKAYSWVNIAEEWTKHFK